jgi:ribokinase
MTRIRAKTPPPPSDARLVLLQNEIPLERTISALETASTSGTIPVFNPSPLPRPDQRERIPWERVDWLVVNEDEARELGAEVTARCRAVVTTLGKRGAEVRLRESADTLRRPAGVVGLAGVVDTTGAGDCFTVRAGVCLRRVR